MYGVATEDGYISLCFSAAEICSGLAYLIICLADARKLPLELSFSQCEEVALLGFLS